MTIHDRNMHAFFADDTEQLSRLMQEQDPAQATPEELLLFGSSCDALGLNQPEKMRFYLEQLRRRYPATPFGIKSQTLLERLPPVAFSKNEL